MTLSPQLRKAAVLLRTLDADTSAALLSQLSTDDANAIRSTLRELGPLDPEEQADVVAEFRRTAPLARESAGSGVEVEFTLQAPSGTAELSPANLSSTLCGPRRFEFLDDAPIEVIVPCLTREHVQTIAVVLSYLSPQRAAAVLVALPAAIQPEVIERLSAIGETDPESLAAVECELSAWLAQRTAGPRNGSGRPDAVVSILSAADHVARDKIMATLRTHKAPLAKRIAPLLPSSAKRSRPDGESQADNLRRVRARELASFRGEAQNPRPPKSPASPQVAPRPAVPLSPTSFDDVFRLSPTELSSLVDDVEPNLLMLALAGSTDELVDHVCAAMPRRKARALRHQLGRLGPTRLTDVAAAGQIIAGLAASRLVNRRRDAVAAA
jgi:flagellar motor switch protein FliG